MKLSYLILLILLIFSEISVIANDNVVSSSDKRKAEYIYLEAVNQLSQENPGGFYDLINRAYEIDSTNSVIAYYYGYSKLFNKGNNEQMLYDYLSLMRELADTPSESTDEVYMYGSLQNKFGNYDEAIRVWSGLQARNPDDIDVMISLAETYTRKGDYSASIEQYNLIEKNEGAIPEVSLRKINLYLAMKDTTNVIAEGRSLLNTAPNNSSNIQIMGNIFMQLGVVDSAMVYYQKAERVEPANGYINMDMAEYYQSIGDTLNYDIQVEKLLISKGVDINDKLKFIHDYIADLIKSESNTDKVSNLFNLLLDNHPHQREIHELYADFLLVKNDYVAALEQISYQLDQDPMNDEMWQKMMFIALMANNYEKARYAAEKAIYYNPDNLELYLYIAPIYMQIGEYDKATELYNQAIEKTNADDYKQLSSLYGGLGDVCHYKGDTICAIEQYKLALKLDDGNLLIMNNYAYLLAEMGVELELAEKMSRLVIQEIPDNASNLDTYAWIMFKMERYADALKYIEMAAKLEPEHSSELLEHYGDILYMIGAVDLAVERWQAAVKLEPESERLKLKIKERRYIAK